MFQLCYLEHVILDLQVLAKLIEKPERDMILKLNAEHIKLMQIGHFVLLYFHQGVWIQERYQVVWFQLYFLFNLHEKLISVLQHLIIMDLLSLANSLDDLLLRVLYVIFFKVYLSN